MRKYFSCSDRSLLYFTIIWFMLMMFLSHQPGPDTARTSSGISLFIANLLSMDHHEVHGFIRHAAHVGLYMVLAISMGTLLRYRGCSWLTVLGVLVAIAVLDEATKPLVAGRHCDIEDIGLNCVGNLMGLVWLRLKGID